MQDLIFIKFMKKSGTGKEQVVRMTERAVIICCGFLLDILLGDPQRLWHPVRAIGKIIVWSEKLLRRILKISDEREADIGKKYAAGTLLVLITFILSTQIPALILFLLYDIHPYLAAAAEIIMCYRILAMKALKKESMKVYAALKEGNIAQARSAVSMIVGRDTERLDEKGIIRAAVETVAENTTDGVIAPLIFLLLFGPVGGFFYKAVNTLDSMVGYKNDRYLYLGTAAAKLDDLINYVPARISALAMIGASFLLRQNTKNAIRIFRRDRYKHASPNSAQTEAVCAGALEIQLAGDAYYFGKRYGKPTIGEPVREAEADDIVRVNRMMYTASFLMLFIGISVLCLPAVCIWLAK